MLFTLIKSFPFAKYFSFLHTESCQVCLYFLLCHKVFCSNWFRKTIYLGAYTAMFTWNYLLTCLWSNFGTFKTVWWRIKVLPRLCLHEDSKPLIRPFKWDTMYVVFQKTFRKSCHFSMNNRFSDVTCPLIWL